MKAVWVDSASSVKGYSISGITLNTPTVLSAVYYDSYGFMGKSNSIPNDATTAYAEVTGTANVTRADAWGSRREHT